MSDMLWEKVELEQSATLERAIAAIAAFNDAAGHASLFHDPVWLLQAEDRSVRDVALFFCRRDADIVGYAPFVIQSWPMRFMIGEITLFSAQLQRLHLHGGPNIHADGFSESELAVSLFTHLEHKLKPHQVLYLEGVPREGPIDRALADPRLNRYYRILKLGAPYERRLIKFPDNFDNYLQSLSRHTRQNLRTGYRKLINHLGGDPKLVSCTTAAEVPEFVRKAVVISKKTYQWHLLGLGLRKPQQLERTLTAMANQGWTKCYLFECGGVATAFMIGYQHHGTYYYFDVGFDPTWEKWSVGTLLHMAVMRDLLEGGDRPRWFDFSSGTGPQKERFSNQSRFEANYLLVPRSLRGFVLVGIYRGMTAISDPVARLLDKLHLKAAVKRIVRRRSTSDASPE